MHCDEDQRELFLSEVNNRETIATIEATNDAYCPQKRIEKVPADEDMFVKQPMVSFV